MEKEPVQDISVALELFSGVIKSSKLSGLGTDFTDIQRTGVLSERLTVFVQFLNGLESLIQTVPSGILESPEGHQFLMSSLKLYAKMNRAAQHMANAGGVNQKDPSKPTIQISPN